MEAAVAVKSTMRSRRLALWVSPVWLLLSAGSSSGVSALSVSRRRTSTSTPTTTSCGGARGRDSGRSREGCTASWLQKAALPSSSSSLQVLEGGASDPETALKPSANRRETAVQRVAAVTMATAAAVLLSMLVFRNRDVLLNKERIQSEALRLLESLKDDDRPAVSLALYALGIAAWELCSLSTIPVETAAGMVFGWKAAPASVSGKLLGAGTAFALGRTCLKRWAGVKLESNPLWQLVTSNRHSPWATAFLMKYSCFPEFVKNFGSSLLDPVTPLMFFVATIVHGGGFTLLWTWWGVETALKLRTPGGHATSLGLKCALVLAGFVGVVLTPLLMAWWINSLRREASMIDGTSAGTTKTKKP